MCILWCRLCKAISVEMVYCSFTLSCSYGKIVGVCCCFGIKTDNWWLLGGGQRTYLEQCWRSRRRLQDRWRVGCSAGSSATSQKAAARTGVAAWRRREELPNGGMPDVGAGWLRAVLKLCASWMAGNALPQCSTIKFTFFMRVLSILFLSSFSFEVSTW